MNTVEQTDTAAKTVAFNSAATLLAGSFANDVAAIWAGERRNEYLTAPDARRHVWHAWLAAHEIATAATAEASYEHLMHARGRVLMADAYGACPAGLLSALGRLGPQARHPKAYRALVDLLARGGAAAKHVCHAKEITDGLIVGLAALPERMARSHEAVASLVKLGLSGQGLATFAWALTRMHAFFGEDATDTVLDAAKPWEALWETHLAHGFPPPPWPATERLLPVDSAARLHEAGHRLKNCLRGGEYLRELSRRVVDGTTYFYEWRGEEAALLMFRRVGRLGWYLSESGGAGNHWLSAGSRDAIVAELRRIREICPLVDVDPVGFRLGLAPNFYVEDTFGWGE